MGNACFVAARDKTVQSGPTNENSLRNIRNSPTWSFRWDHRGRVAGEDTSINWFSDGNSRNGGSETKNESGRVLENGSPAQNCQLNTCQKSPISEGTGANVRDSTSGNLHIVSFLDLTMWFGLFRVVFCISYFTIHPV